MNTLTIQKSVLGFTLGVLLLGAVFNPLTAAPARAQSLADLQAQIQILLAQVAALQAQLAGNTQTPGTGVTYLRNLTVGSTGADVTSLQQFLISKGHAIPAGATSYFGPQTKAALAAYQSTQGITPAVGYFGPITRANVNALNTNTGTTPPANNTGNTGGNNSGGALQGGAGSVSEFKLTSGFHSEEVGENATDVEVAGLDIKVDKNSDIRLTAVTLVFDEETATTRFDRYADEVSLWLDDEEVARVDASTFNKSNNWSKTVSLKGETIIKRGTTGTLVVAISGARNIDSANLGHSWSVDFRSVRFVDAQGATILENPNTAARTFSFESFAAAANVKLKITEGDASINTPQVLNVHATNKTRDVNLLSFDMEIEGNSDVALDSLPVAFTVTGADHLDDMVSAAYLYMDGKRIGSTNVPTNEDTIVFDDLDLTLRSGRTYEFIVTVDFLPLSGALNAGDTISATIGETQTDSSAFDAEDEAGEELRDVDKTGNATGGAHIVYDTGIRVSFVSASESVTSNTGADNDSGIFTVKYQVEAFDGVVYVATAPGATTSDSIAATTIDTNGLLYLVDKAGVAVTDDLSAFASWKKVKGSPTSATNGVRMNDGDIVEFTLSVVRTNNGDVNDDGIFRMLVKAIGWNTDNSTTYNVYDFDLGDYKTDPVYLN